MRLVHRIRIWHRALDTRLRALQTDPPADPYADALHIADQYRQRQEQLSDEPYAESPDTRICRRLEWWR